MLADRMRMSFRNLLGKLNITIDHTKIDSTLTDYPVMVKLDEINFDFSKIREDGKGIRFKDSNGNYLAHEVEYFTTNKAIFHIKVPIVSSTVDTKISMEYSLAYETDYSDKTNVWDSNFVMVQHMGESLVDSTGNGNDGTNYGTTVVDGLNGKARSFDGNDIVAISSFWNTTGTSVISIQKLVKTSDASTSVMFSSYNDDTATTLVQSVLNSGKHAIAGRRISADSYRTLSTSFAIDGSWQSYVGILDFSNATGYIYSNGVKKLEDSFQTAGSSDDILYAKIGSQGNGTFLYTGQIEELRISNIARSDAWIKADDYNLRQNNLITIE